MNDGDGLFLYFVPADNYVINVHFPVPEGRKVAETWFNPLSSEFIKKGVQDYRSWKGYGTPWEGVSSVLILEVEE